jgi:hypothetical protein
MERVITLIQKLQQQLEMKETAEKLLLTVQMLYSELIAEKSLSTTSSSGSVVVIMPAKLHELIKDIQYDKSLSLSNESNPLTEEKIFEVLQVDEKEIEQELEEIKRNAEAKNKMSSLAKPFLLFDPVEDVPTLTHQTPINPPPKEVNETAATTTESLNERLKESRTELAQRLTDEPIKDLKKGIGVNDRFLFINELFRGDEAMYERSVKTINNFSILAEAEYWIRRELKIKIGWSDADPVVKQFDQLVRRRFF